MKALNKMIRGSIIFIVFGSIYYCLEILYDGGSHWSMFICAGITGILANYIQENFLDMKIISKAILITTNILVLEYITGSIFNLYFKLNIWDYSGLPYNLSGQVCLLFASIWFFLFSPLIIWLVEGIKYIFFGEQKPRMLYNYYAQFIMQIIRLTNKINHRVKN